MNPRTPKRAKRDAKAKPYRDELAKEPCDLCGTTHRARCGHEIGMAKGGLRGKCQDLPYATLCLCMTEYGVRGCHEKVHAWNNEKRELALLYMARQSSYDLKSFLLVTRENAPNRITQKEVDEEMKVLLLEKGTK